MFSFVPSPITQPFFELQTPDFAWKFVWTVPTNYEKKHCKKKKKLKKKNLKFGRRYRSSLLIFLLLLTKTHLSTEWHTDILIYRDASFYVVWDVWKCTCSPNYLPSYYTNTAVESTLAVFYRMLTIIPSKDVLIISIIWRTFTRMSWILMAKCGSFLWHFQGSSSYWLSLE